MTLPIDKVERLPLHDNLAPVRSTKPVHAPVTPGQKKLLGACKDFEAVMVGMMLKQMRATVKTDDPLEKGAANQTYRDMLDEEMAKGMSKARGIGLAEGIYRQLQDTV